MDKYVIIFYKETGESGAFVSIEYPLILTLGGEDKTDVHIVAVGLGGFVS